MHVFLPTTTPPTSMKLWMGENLINLTICFKKYTKKTSRKLNKGTCSTLAVIIHKNFFSLTVNIM